MGLLDKLDMLDKKGGGECVICSRSRFKTLLA
jgi:hypothetical protein